MSSNGEGVNFQRPLVDPRAHPDAKGGKLFVAYRQELPPPGGYPKFPVLRYKPWNINGYWIWGTFLAFTTFGYYKLYVSSLKIRYVIIQIEKQRE